MAGSTAGEAAAEYGAALELAPSHRASLERLMALGMGDAVVGVGRVAAAEEPESVEPDGARTEPTVRERLLLLTPETPWGVDLSGKVELLGITLEGGIDEQGGPAAGFTARFLWEVCDDLDPTAYYVAYQYFDADGHALYRDWKTLFPEPERYGGNLDGGVGTVLVHWDYLPFPPGAAREVRILVGHKRKGKAAPPPLTSLTGNRWLILGLPQRPGQRNF
jgi:hypothetical protein